MVAHFFLKTAVGNLGTLRLPREPRRLGRTDSHPTGDGYGTRFMLSPELAEGSKHERATAVSRFNGERLLKAETGRGPNVIKRTERGWNRVFRTSPIFIDINLKTEGPAPQRRFCPPLWCLRLQISHHVCCESRWSFRAWRFPDDPWLE